MTSFAVPIVENHCQFVANTAAQVDTLSVTPTCGNFVAQNSIRGEEPTRSSVKVELVRKVLECRRSRE